MGRPVSDAHVKAGRPMLAASIEPDSLHMLTYPVMLSPKLDGIRALERDGRLLSRRLLPLPNMALQEAARNLLDTCFDGELIYGSPHAHDVCNVTTSAVMSMDGPRPGALLQYHVFDVTDRPDWRYADRLAQARDRIRALAIPWVKLVMHVTANDAERVAEFESVRIIMGYEGIMIRSPVALYKNGRSTLREGGLIKLKRFVDGEAKIIGAVELRKNTNEKTTNALGLSERSHRNAGMVGQGTLGTLVVKDLKNNVVFELGTGYTSEQRARLWGQRDALIGKIVRYRYQHVGTIDKPRIPVFISFRDPIDIGE